MSVRHIHPKQRVSVVLPGGGALCAHQAAVMIAFLRSPEVLSGQTEIVDLKGTSGGAINATLIAAGLNNGGPEVAADNLERFWNNLADIDSVPHEFVQAAYQGYKVAEFGADMMKHQIRMAKICSRLPFMKPLIEYLVKAAEIQLKAYETVRRIPFMNAGILLKDLLKGIISDADMKSIREGDVRIEINYVNRKTKTEKVVRKADLTLQDVLDSTKLKIIACANENLDGAYANNPNMDSISDFHDVDRVLFVGTQALPEGHIYPAHQRDAAGLSDGDITKEALTWQTYHHVALLAEKLRPKNISVDVCNLGHHPDWGEDRKLDTSREWIDFLMRQGETDYHHMALTRQQHPHADLSDEKWMRQRRVSVNLPQSALIAK